MLYVERLICLVFRHKNKLLFLMVIIFISDIPPNQVGAPYIN